jgi:16S rRNA (cytosine967-C5)-methyltransferase
MWLRFNNQPARLTLAANRLRLDRQGLAERLSEAGFESEVTAAAPAGLLFDDARVLSAAAVREGDAVVQDEASQIIPELVRAEPGTRVLDACAAPGGKTLALAAQVGPDGLVVAADVRPRRIRLLASTIARTGADRVRITQVSDRGALPFADAVFDYVLVDAPCSGLGTLRRDPDIRWRRMSGDLPRLAAAQLELLRRIAPHVARGGRLIYSTCSSEPEENEDVVTRFLQSGPDFRLVPVPQVDTLPPAIALLATPEGNLRTSPVQGLEAFFGAVLQRVR